MSTTPTPPPPNPPDQSKKNYRNPIIVIAYIIIVSVILLIMANVLGLDRGNTLYNLSQRDFARGLITYLFAVGTIGVLVAVIVAALLGEGSVDDKIERAKGILTTLIGIFGTILGFYFGSEGNADETSFYPPIEIKEIKVPDTIHIDSAFELNTKVIGGFPPYNYHIIADDMAFNGRTDHKIEQEITIKSGKDSISLTVIINDKKGISATRKTSVPLGNK